MRSFDVYTRPLRRSTDFSGPQTAVLFVLFALIASIPVITHPLPPLTDYVNHLARMHVIASIGNDRPLHPDFGTVYQGAPSGIPYIVVDGKQKKVPITFTYGDESDPGPYPVPPDAPIEGGPKAKGDRHSLVLMRDGIVPTPQRGLDQARQLVSSPRVGDRRIECGRPVSGFRVLALLLVHKQRYGYRSASPEAAVATRIRGSEAARISIHQRA